MVAGGPIWMGGGMRVGRPVSTSHGWTELRSARAGYADALRQLGGIRGLIGSLHKRGYHQAASLRQSSPTSAEVPRVSARQPSPSARRVWHPPAALIITVSSLDVLSLRGQAV